MDRLDWSAWGEKARKALISEAIKLEKQMVPEALRDEALQRELGDFFTACILYDPPDDKLIEFARCGGPTSVSSGREKSAEPSKRQYGAPPMRVVRDPDQTEIKRVVHVGQLLEEIDQEYPEIRVWEFVEERGLFDRFRSEMEQIPRRYYIDVREDTTARDVADAYKLIRDIQKDQHQSGGAPNRDSLIAFQCAILYDRHNGRDPQDRRRKKWTYEKLKEQFVLRGPSAAADYVRLGREILKAKPKE